MRFSRLIAVTLLSFGVLLLATVTLEAQSGAGGRGRSRGPSTARVRVVVPDGLVNRTVNAPLREVQVFVDGSSTGSLEFEVPAGRRSIEVRTGGVSAATTLELVAGEEYTFVPQFSINISTSQKVQTQPSPAPATTSDTERGPDNGARQNQGTNAASTGSGDEGSTPGRFGPLRYGWYEIKPGMIGMAADYEYLRFSPDGSVMYRSGTDPQPVPRGYYEWDGTILRHYDGPNDSRPREWRRVGPTEFESLDSNPDLGPDRLEFDQ